MRAPSPRYRLYTTPRHYGRLLADLVRPGAGPEAAVQDLERATAEFVGVEHAVAVPQNRVGTYLVLRALVRPGRKVVCSPYTLSDVINMVICAGAVPVFADIEPETCNIDPNEVERLVDRETDAILVTHLHGLICDMDRLRDISRRHGIPLIEDAAQSFGSSRGGTQAGAFGDAGVYSFGLYKNVTGFYGGMVVTPHSDLASQLRREVAGLPRQPQSRLSRKAVTGLATDLATYPPAFKAFTYWVFRHAYLHDWHFFTRQVTIENDVRLKREIPPEYLARMRPSQARMILDSLPGVREDRDRRIRAAEIYAEGLAEVPGVRIPPLLRDGSHGYLYYPIQTSDRAQLLRHMIRAGRDVAVQHLRNCAELEAFASYRRNCPQAAVTASETVLLSTYPRYPLSEVRENVAAIRSFYLDG